MRSSFALLLIALSAVPLAAQEPWVASVGVQGGYSRLKPAGTGRSDQIDLYQIPGASVLDVFGTYGALFGIIPIHKRFAIEPSFRFTQHSPPAFAGTNVVLGVRADVAIQKGLYAAAGPQLNYVEGGVLGMSLHQLGVQAGVGYRFRLSSVLDGRVEANALFFKKDSILPPYNVYSLLFGVAGHLPSHAAPAAGHRGGAAAAAGPRPIWRWALGAMAGYTRSHSVTGGDQATFSIPGSGASNSSVFTGAPGVPTLFAIAPIHGRLAVELGFDFQQENPNVITGNTIATGQLAPRLDVAVADKWYGAIGAREYIVRVSDVTKTSAVSGLQLGWGYRFDLTNGGSLRGRAEINYAMFATNHTVGTPAFNSLGFLAGVAFPLH